MSPLLKARHLKGRVSARGLKFGIVVSRFNEVLTSCLLEGALDTLAAHGARPRDVTVVHVPGAFETPLALKKMLKVRRPDAGLVLSVVIRGETRHFDQVVREAARGVREAADKSDIPVIFGMIPAENTRQALERVGIKRLNTGREWALGGIPGAALLQRRT